MVLRRNMEEQEIENSWEERKVEWDTLPEKMLLKNAFKKDRTGELGPYGG